MPQTTCPKCGSKTEETDRFCKLCGWRLADPVSPEVKRKADEQQKAKAAKKREIEQHEALLRQLQADGRYYACSLCGAHNQVHLHNHCPICNTRPPDTSEAFRRQLVPPGSVRPAIRALEDVRPCRTCATPFSAIAMIGTWVETELRDGGGPQTHVFDYPDWATPETLSFKRPWMETYQTCSSALRRKRQQETPPISNSHNGPHVDLAETLLMERATHLWEELVSIAAPDPHLSFMGQGTRIEAIYLKPCPECSERDVFGLEAFLGDATRYLKPAKWHGRTLKDRTR